MFSFLNLNNKDITQRLPSAHCLVQELSTRRVLSAHLLYSTRGSKRPRMESCSEDQAHREQSWDWG